MLNQPKVSVVILNWNGKPFLEKFLPSVLSSTYPNLEIIVADNNSSDDTIQFLKASYPTVKIIQNSENFGFAGGYNAALQKVDSEYLVLLNSDVEVSSGWIEPVISLMQGDELIAATQPKLKDYNNKQSFEYAGAAGGFLDSFGYPFCRGRVFDTLEGDNGQYDMPTEIFWASGAALFIRKKLWDKVSGFDADFFAHMEEIDLCWRLKNLGYKIWYCPQSVVYHIGGGTLQAENPYKTYLNFRNNLMMILKNIPGFKAYLVLYIRIWLDLLSLFKFVLDGKYKHAQAISKAHISFFKTFNNTLKKRGAGSQKANTTGLYKGSVVWEYFIKKKKYFSEL